MRRRVFAAVTVLAALMSVTAAAQAEDAATDKISGRGYIWAKGSGVAILDGQGKVQMGIDGDVVIYDLAGDAVVRIRAVPEGRRDASAMEEVDPTTTYTFDNFRGRLQVVGSDFRIEAEGKMRFRGHGQGVVELDGRGWWKTLRKRGTWSGVTLTFGGAEVRAS